MQLCQLHFAGHPGEFIKPEGRFEHQSVRRHFRVRCVRKPADPASTIDARLSGAMCFEKKTRA